MNRTVLLDTGSALLTSQFNGEINPIQITSFKIGDGVGESIMKSSIDVQGAVLYAGVAESITYTPRHDDEVLLRFVVERDTGTGEYILPGNIMIFANAGIPLFSAIDVTPFTAKFPASSNNVGALLVYQFILNIPGLVNRFDFSNLEHDSAQFATYETDRDLPTWPWRELADQMFIEEDSRTGAPAFVIQTGRLFWGLPNVQDYDGDFLY